MEFLAGFFEFLMALLYGGALLVFLFLIYSACWDWDESVREAKRNLRKDRRNRKK